MTMKAPGKAHRDGISFSKLFRMFPDDDAARAWFGSKMWPDGPFCPYCGSFNVQTGVKHKSMTHRCRDCDKRPMFSLKTGNIMEGSKLGYQAWAIAIYLATTSLKGVSSMKLHRDLEITQKSAWHLMHRLRKAYGGSNPLFSGPVEADETFVGGKRSNMPKARRKELSGRGAVGKSVVAGMKDRGSNKVRANVVGDTSAGTLQGFVRDNAEPGAMVYTDEAGAYQGMVEYSHEAVKHGAGEYVRGMAHTNGIESFWSMLKRAHKGTFHKFSPKHLDRYVQEFAGRHNLREQDTIDMMAAVAEGMKGERLRYQDLIADNGLDSGARA